MKEEILKKIEDLEKDLKEQKALLENCPKEVNPVLKKGVVLKDLYYVSEYTFQECFDGGEILSADEILGEPDFHKNDLVFLMKGDDGYRVWTDVNEDYYIPENSKWVKEL